MTGAEAGRLVALIAAAYPRQSFDHETVALYASRISDLEYQSTLDMLNLWIDRESYPPTIADIRNRAVKRESLPQLYARLRAEREKVNMALGESIHADSDSENQ